MIWEHENVNEYTFMRMRMGRSEQIEQIEFEMGTIWNRNRNNWNWIKDQSKIYACNHNQSNGWIKFNFKFFKKSKKKEETENQDQERKEFWTYVY